MQCEVCAYNLDAPSAAICSRCGRYGANKAADFLMVLGAGIALAIISNYLLTASALGGDRLIWMAQALRVPGSIYTDRAYLVAVVVSLAGLLILSSLAGFHYGALRGLLIALPMGILGGVHLGWIALVPVTCATAIVRIKGVHPAVWPVCATAIGGGYFFWLAWAKGPSAERALLYRQALLSVMGVAGLAAVAAVAAAALVATRTRYRSSYLPVAACLLAALPGSLLLWAVPPSRLHANIITTLYEPRHSLAGPLGEGFITGTPPGETYELAAPKQLGNVFEVVRFVDAGRARGVLAARRYMERFGNSPAASQVLLLEADMHNARVDMKALKLFNRLECYFDMVTPQAVEIYTVLIERFPDTPQAALARYGRAEGLLQDGLIAQARPGFIEAATDLARHIPMDFEPVEVMPPDSLAELFDMSGSRRRLLLNDLWQALQASRRRIHLVDNNHDYAGRPLARLAALDQRDGDFERKAAEILADYPDSLIADNVHLELALRVRDPLERAEKIEKLLKRHPDSDVLDMMLLELARSYRAGSLGGTGDSRAEQILRRLLNEHPESTWAFDARRLLRKAADSDS